MSIYTMYSSEGNQTAKVCICVVNDAMAVDTTLRQRLSYVDNFIENDFFDNSSWSTENRTKNHVQTESGDFETWCTAEEFVYFVLNALIENDPQATITEICCNDVVYRNITDITTLSNEDEPDVTSLFPCTYSYSLKAEKAGMPCMVYAFPGYTIIENSQYVSNTLSGHGIVDIPLDSTSAKHIYVGCYTLYVEDNCIDYSVSYDKAHIFLEAAKDKMLFKVLVDNKLHNKISYTAGDSLVYSSTPFETTLYLNDDVISYDRYIDDIVFSNTDGAYIYSNNSGFGEMTINPPQLPAFEDITAATSQNLFKQLVRLYFASCKTTQVFKNNKYTFIRQEGTDLFCAEDNNLNIIGKLKKRYNNCPDIYFRENFSSPYTLSIESVEVKSSHSVVSLYGFNKNDLNVKYICDTNEAIELTFSELKKYNVFKDKKNIPDNIFFDNCKLYSILDNISILSNIANAVNDFGYFKLAAVSSPHFLEDPIKMQNAIYDAGMTPDTDVVAKAVELKKCFNRTGKIPNVAIIGEAGCGKSTLIKKLGNALGKEVMCLSPSDLKGAYIGHTKREVIDNLISAMKENKIFFIDEVYELMTDSFGREAISLLLPLMTGDRTTADIRMDKTHIYVDFCEGKVYYNDKLEYEAPAELKGVPTIWIAGYEDDVRIMLSKNQGLFRRFERLTLKTPHTIELYNDLLKKLESTLSAPEDEAVYNCMKKLFESNEKLITNYFRWGNQPQNSKYFANFAGVDKLLSSCLDRLPFDKSEDELRRELESIISSNKRDIKRQLSTLMRMKSKADKNANDADNIEIISDIDTRFTDLVGCDKQIEYMRSIIKMLVYKNKYDSYNISVPKGALLKGLPGVGKTFISRAFAGEMQEAFEKEAPDKRVGFMALSATELTNRSTDFIASVFNATEEYDFCVIFIDEVDSIAMHRRHNPYYRHYLELIKQMDGIEQRSNFFILAATNAPESLDPAFVRSGRIDKEFEFLLPDKEARATLVERAVTKRSRILNNFVYENDKEAVSELANDIANHTAMYTAGDIDNVINLAFIMYDNEPEPDNNQSGKTRAKCRFSHPELDKLYCHILEAIERKNIGEPNPNAKEAAFTLDANNNSCSSTAIHEVGHALVSILCENEPFDKITILPRGNALGYVSHNSGNLQINKKGLKDRIRIAMGGRIAEALIYGEDYISAGASQDMAMATNVARYMVENIGFTDDFGFMTLVKNTSNYLGGKEYTCSDAFRERSDEAVCNLLRELYTDTVNMLSDKKELIKSLAKSVFNAETMTGSDFIKLYKEKCAKS